jgi:hypothetical protein
MVLGEPQILGQMKQAVRMADEAGTLGTTLHQLFQRSFSVAKEVRTSTEIGSHSISMAAAAVRLASQLFEDMAQVKVLFVGAGEMIELVATHFAARTPKAWRWPTARWSAASIWPPSFGAQAMRLSDMPNRLHEFDAVISCTASSAAHHRPGRGGARAEGAPPPADVHGRPGRAARHRTRGRAAGRRLPVHGGRPVGTGADRRRKAPGRRGRPKPSSTPACRALRTGWTSAPPCR